MTTLGVIGAGLIGSQVARVAVASGVDVVISNSRGPETLGELVAELGPTARAATTADAATAGDLVLVSIPFKNYRDMPADLLAGKVVMDTTNYNPTRDGRIVEIEDGTTTNSELLQEHLAASKVVKIFNHIRAAEITTDGTPPGTPNRRALAIAGDDADAKRTVTELLDRFGFDTVDVGSMSEAWRMHHRNPALVEPQGAESLRACLAAAGRPDWS